MPKKVYFALALHNHQPIGNFDSVFAEAYEKSYEPMLAALERHPGVRVTLHNTGPLIEWMRKNRPDYLSRVAALVQRGQLEIMAGGYYEPILATLPDADKLGQIRRMVSEVREDFKYEPKGMWLAERVWEPTLPRYINEAGVSYTIVDDNHFKSVGLNDDDLYGYYVTEEQGRAVNIFATGQPLRYRIPWRPVEEIIEFLHDNLRDGQIAVMGDDGEKFGLWPGTYEYCFGDNQWVERFFTALEQNSAWLETTHPAQYMAEHPPIGRIYLPTASYIEMTEWALPPTLSFDFHQLLHQMGESKDERDLSIMRFMRGGFWRNMMVKYPEINNMHKKMLKVHHKVYAMKEGAAREAALDHLWRGQCNCPYWHGLFGGIYYPHIRTGTFGELISAENAADGISFDSNYTVKDGGKLAGKLEVELTDLNTDGHNEALISGAAQTIYLQPSMGGALYEWDLRPRSFNLLNTMTRRQEAYHRTLTEAVIRQGQQAEGQASAGGTGRSGQGSDGGKEGEVKNAHDIVAMKEPGLEGKLFYDWHQRVGLLDHFISADTSLQSFYESRYGEQGDFVNQPYGVQVEHHEGSGLAVITMQRAGHVWDGPEFAPVTVQKVVSIHADASDFSVDYTVTNSGDKPHHLTFGVEQNLALLSGHAPDSYYLINGERPYGADADLASIGESNGARAVTLINGWFGVQVSLAWDKPCTLWRLPIETVQNSEAGFERVYQASCLLPHWSFTLQAGESWRVILHYRAEAVHGGIDD